MKILPNIQKKNLEKDIDDYARNEFENEKKNKKFESYAEDVKNANRGIVLRATQEKFEKRQEKIKNEKFKRQWYIIYEEEKKDAYKSVSNFNRFYGIHRIFNWDIAETEVYKKYVESFKEKTFNVEIKIKYTTEKNVVELIKKIISYQDISINFNNYEMKIIGTSFKPTSYYANSFTMEKYFMAFKLFSSIGVKFNKNNDKTYMLEDAIKTSIIISKLCNDNNHIKEFNDFISMLVCKPFTYNVFNIPDFVNMNSSLKEIYNALNDNMDSIVNEYLKNNTEFIFDIVGIGLPSDSKVLNELIDDKVIDDDGNKNYPKYPMIGDLLYILFNNSALCDLENKKYVNHLNKLQSKHYNNFENTIYEQQLKMLSKLSEKDKRASFPFNTEKWSEKEAITQISELVYIRHDNVLYLKKLSGLCLMCEYPEIIVEPCLSSWKEFLVLIKMMRKINDDEVMETFEETLKMLIEYLELQLDNKEINEELKKKVYSIARKKAGSGSSWYDGWFPKLFYNEKDSKQHKKEIMTLFTGVPDLRDDGKVISYGVGNVNFIYTLVKNKNESKIFIGMIPSVYEVITSYGTEFNDNEWKEEIKNYNELKIEKK